MSEPTTLFAILADLSARLGEPRTGHRTYRLFDGMEATERSWTWGRVGNNPDSVIVGGASAGVLVKEYGTDRSYVRVWRAPAGWREAAEAELRLPRPVAPEDVRTLLALVGLVDVEVVAHAA